MIRLIVFAVIGLVVGLGGGSGVAIMRAKNAAAALPDSVAAHGDSTAGSQKHAEAANTSGDSSTAHAASPVPVPTDSVASTAHAAAPTAAKDSVVAAPANAGTTHAAPPVQSTPTLTPPKPPAGNAVAEQPASPGRIAKIFGAMSAKDAARVLQQMDDADVQTVLSGLNDRQAAAILAGFPPERAAAISRASLRKKGAS